MPQTKPLKKVARVIASNGKGTRSEKSGRLAVAAESLNIVHKRPGPGSPSAEALASGLGASPAHNLRFRGGRTVPKLTYMNLYVGGKAAWAPADIQNIDRALGAAMTDPRLNTVINQYFPNGPVTTTVVPSQVLTGSKPDTVTRTTMDALVREQVLSAGRLNQFDPATTLFNFFLPRGVVLTTDTDGQSAAEESASSPFSVNTVTTIRSGKVVTTVTVATTATAADRPASRDKDGDKDGDRKGGPRIADPDDAASSLNGLGGYHGSVHAGGTVIYFAVGVFSESLPDGSQNGIVAFDEPWKNVVATFYHELQEARTDPDVEDAIRTQNLNFIGWNSDQGEEIGDFPVFEADPLQQVFKEVPLVNGDTVPIQLVYSNRVNGPEDPTA
ncbi:MAG TPA: hypothetical protein VE641_19050 [Chthoniobacterales bacterium]|nr:hypothetical protein [Chthoniobacterales bacterium]